MSSDILSTRCLQGEGGTGDMWTSRHKTSKHIFFVLGYGVCVLIFRVWPWKEKTFTSSQSFFFRGRERDNCNQRLNGPDICGLIADVSMHSGMPASVSCFQSAEEESVTLCDLTAARENIKNRQRKEQCRPAKHLSFTTNTLVCHAKSSITVLGQAGNNKIITKMLNAVGVQTEC